MVQREKNVPDAVMILPINPGPLIPRIDLDIDPDRVLQSGLKPFDGLDRFDQQVQMDTGSEGVDGLNGPDVHRESDRDVRPSVPCEPFGHIRA